MGKLSSGERRLWIRDKLPDWGWNNFEKGKNGLSYKDMRLRLIATHGKDSGVSAVTIMHDINRLREEATTLPKGQRAEALDLLDPHRFPEWRARWFRTPDGQPYETPKFQHAIFWVMHAATFKVPLPRWVIDLLDELDPQHPFPDDINELITGEKQSFLSLLLLMAPRHGKTELTIHFMLHTYAIDPNRRLMFGNGTQRKSEGFIDNSIMSMMEPYDPLSQQFIEAYGPFRDPNRPWSKTGFTLAGREYMNKMYSMQPYGLSGNIRSFDSDAIIGDDLADLQRSRSDTITEQDYNWVTAELMARREPGTALLMLGSHVAVPSGDLFTRLINNVEKLNVGMSRFVIKTIPAHFYQKCDIVNDPEHRNCVLWDKRPYEFLEAKRNELDDDAMFEAMYNQVPMQVKMMHFPADVLRARYVYPEIPDGSQVRPPPSKNDGAGALDFTRSWRELPIFCCSKETAVGFGFDPAVSESQGAAFTAIRVGAVCTRCGRRYAVDYGKDKMSPEMHPDFIESFVREYPQIEIGVIESNVYQKALARDPRMEKLAETYGFYIKEWRTDERKDDPTFGIPRLGRHFKSGMHSIPYKNLEDQEYAEPLLKEYIRWPQRPNDLIMAGYVLDTGLSEILEDARYTSASLMPGAEQWMTDNHAEQTYEVDMHADFVNAEWEYS